MPTNRVLMLALGVLLAASPALAPAKNAEAPAAVAPLETVLTMSVDGRLVIEKDGTVGDFSISTPLTAGMSPMLDKAIRGLRFQPIVIDGLLVRAESPMRIALAATQVGENYQVRIENIVFPKEKVLLEADGYNPPAATATPPSPPSPFTLSLLDNIQRLKLDVQRIVPVHYPADNRVVTMAEVTKWVGRTSSTQ